MEPSGGYQPEGVPGRKKRILSFDGGGVRGLLSAVILERLESYLQILEGKDARIADYFDVIAGTSTGALIACLLVVLDPETKRPYTAQDAVSFYLEDSEKIFPRSSESVEGLLRYPKYSSAPLEKLLKDTFGDLNLSDTFKPVIVPSYDMQDGICVQFSTAQVESKEIPDCFLRDVCRATTAAPTYFSPYYFSATTDDGVTREFNMVDGGLSANNPTLIAVSELLRDDSKKGIPGKEPPVKNPPNYDDLLVLSLGTGKTTVSYSAKAAATWGTYSWVHDNKWNVPILDMLLTASQDIVDYTLSNTLYEQGSQDNYLRTSKLTGDQTKMDNSSASNLKSLENTANDLLKEPPQMRDRSGKYVPDPRWPTNDAALKQFAQWLVDEKEAQSQRV